MKSIIVPVLCSLILGGCCATSANRVIDEDFWGDLAYENNRIAAILSREIYHGPLDRLTYDEYVRYLADHQSPSAEGLACAIKGADGRYFAAKGDSLLIVLFYKDAGQIVGDNSATTRPDTIIYTAKTGKTQSVEEIARLMRF
jgi:hypothetical protein